MTKTTPTPTTPEATAALKPVETATQTPATAPIVKVEPTNAADEAARKATDAEAAKPTKGRRVTAKGDLATAVHQIHTVNDEGEPLVIEPGTVFTPPAVDVEFYTKQGAIREPTDGELAIYERTEGRKVKTPADIDAIGADVADELG